MGARSALRASQNVRSVRWRICVTLRTRLGVRWRYTRARSREDEGETAMFLWSPSFEFSVGYAVFIGVVGARIHIAGEIQRVGKCKRGRKDAAFSEGSCARHTSPYPVLMWLIKIRDARPILRRQ